MGAGGRGELLLPAPRLAKTPGSAAGTPRATGSCPFFAPPLGGRRRATPCRPPSSLGARKLFLETQRVRGLRAVPRGAGALTLLSSLRFIPRLDLYTWYIWAKSILQGEGPGGW